MPHPQVIHLPPKEQRTTRTDALSLIVYEAKIPSNRWCVLAPLCSSAAREPHLRSEFHVDETNDRSLSFAINANDLESQTYYLSVKCSPLEGAHFVITAEFIEAEVTVVRW